MNNNRRESLTKASETHRDTLRKNVQRRLEAARAKDDQSLVRLLEAEANYIG
jgi:hypothetical protein